MLEKIFSFLLLYAVLLNANFNEGKKIFDKKCSSCHGGFISIKEIKKNFFVNKNETLKLSAPTVNMITYDILIGSKHIGDKEDPEIQQMEIEEYLKEYLTNPSLDNSISDPYILKFFKVKKSMKDELSDEEYMYLSIYFMQYNKNRLKNNPITEKKEVAVKKYNDNVLLSYANKNAKPFIIYATSKNCYYCKKMDKEVLQLKVIKKQIQKNFNFVKVDVDTTELPFGLNKQYKKITPTFFIVSKTGKFLTQYPGSWNKEDFLEILQENKK